LKQCEYGILGELLDKGVQRFNMQSGAEPVPYPTFELRDQQGLSCSECDLRWSGKEPPPLIGARVAVPMNSLGAGVVLTYFFEYGWLGVTVLLDEATRPDWHRKQRGSDRRAHVFGNEIRREEAA